MRPLLLRVFDKGFYYYGANVIPKKHRLCFSTAVLDQLVDNKKIAGEASSAEKGTASKAEHEIHKKQQATVIKSVRATEKFFFGPLLETKSQKLQRENREIKENNNVFTSALEICKLYTTGIPIQRPEYEHFAFVHASYPYEFNRQHLNSSYSSRRKYVSANSDHNHQLPLEYSNVPKESPCRNNNIVEISSSEFTDAPRFYDLTAAETFPLFNDGTDIHQSKEAVPRQQKYSGQDLRDGTGSVLSIGYTSEGAKRLPSVSRILADTMSETSKAVLAKWEAKMIAKLGEEGFKEYKKELFGQGSLMHQCIHETLDDSSTSPPSESIAKLGGYWPSIVPMVDEVKGNVAVLESRVIHPHLHYAGIVDCVAVYRNFPVLIEWKTSTKPKSKLEWTYDNPVQVVAYLGAMQFDPRYSHLVDKVREGLLVYSYPSGKKGHHHLLNTRGLGYYWDEWLQRLAQFWQLHAVVHAKVRQAHSSDELEPPRAVSHRSVSPPSAEDH